MRRLRSELGPGWVFVPAFIILASLVFYFLFSPPAQGTTEECPDPARPIHYSVLCLTEAEFVALTTPPPPPVAPTPQNVSPVEVVRVIAYYFWPDWAAERMVRIAKCESNYLPSAVNPSSGAAGIWQIMPGWKKYWPGDYLNPWTNGAVAYQIWLEADRWGDPFSPWVCKGW